MSKSEIKLPQGYSDRPWDYDGPLFTEGQMRAAIELDRQQRGEPVYLFRRKGLDDFVTCTRERYEELSAKPNLFETRILYTAPVAAQPIVPKGFILIGQDHLKELIGEVKFKEIQDECQFET